MHVGAVHPGERALVIDDFVATGGTLSAAIRLLSKLKNVACTPWTTYFSHSLQYFVHSEKFSVLVERVGAEVVECACVVGLPEVEVMLKPYNSCVLSHLLISLLGSISSPIIYHFHKV